MTRELSPAQRSAALQLLARMPQNVQAAAIERAKRERKKRELLASLHDKQREAFALLMAGTYLALCASRRAGKTFLCAVLIAHALLEAGKQEWVVYIAPTAQVGKELIWDQLVELNEQYELGWVMKEHPTPTITTPTGAKFRICGVDDKGQLGKLRGKKYKLVICDEAKEYTHFLRELVDEILGPAFVGVGGRMLITGTPGRVCTEHDYWYAICHALVPAFAQKHWTLRSNTWIKDPEAELAKVRADKGWTKDNVIYLREYEGLWISDESERVYAYQSPPPGSRDGRNSVDGLPANYDVKTWTHIIGIDFGYDPDPCAWVVLAAHPHEKTVYVVHAEKLGELTSDQAAEITAQLIEKYEPSFVVGDSGGLGKPYTEDFNRRHGDRLNCFIEPAQKLGKRDHQEILSEELKAARIKLCLPQAVSLELEWVNLGWKDAQRLVEHQGSPRHCADAALYSYMKMRAYWHKEPAKPPQKTPEQLAAEALAARQQQAAFARKAGAFPSRRF